MEIKINIDEDELLEDLGIEVIKDYLYWQHKTERLIQAMCGVEIEEVLDALVTHHPAELDNFIRKSK